MTKDKALKLALEVNESMKDVLKQVNELIAENKALKEALAQPEQEPVVWMMPKTADKWGLPFYGGQVGKPLYTSSPQRTWVGLTDGELSEFDVDPIEAKLMIAKLKEKNHG